MVGKLLFLFTFVSCSSLDFSQLASIRNHYESDNYVQAIDRLDSFPFKKKKSTLLYHLEKGLNLFRLEAYLDAVTEFQKAKSLIEDIEKKRFTYKGKVTLNNSLRRDFYGEDFERSYLHYYTALSYFLLYQSDKYYSYYKKKHIETPVSRQRQYLFSARAEVKAWSDFFDKQTQKKKSHLYFFDTQLSLLGSIVHQSIGGTNELQIAKSYTKQALVRLGTMNKLYRNFNPQAFRFAENLHEKMKKKQSLKQQSGTDDLKTKRLKKFFKSKLNSSLPKTQNEVYVLIDYGLTPIKRSRVVDLSLNSLYRSDQSFGAKFASLVADVAFRSYLVNTLRMRPSGFFLGDHRHYTYNYYHRRHHSLAGAGPLFQFAVPVIDNNISNKNFMVEVFDIEGTLISSQKSILSSSIGEIAKLTNRDQAGHYLMTTGTRFLVKQALTVAASYASYKALKAKKENSSLAGVAGLLTFWGGSALNSMSERADIRSWSNLPQEIYFSKVELAPGEYLIKLKDAQLDEVVLEKKIQVGTSNQQIFPLKVNKI